MQVSTSQFQFAHAKQPRGFGMWAFEFRFGAGWSEPKFFPTSTFAVAKKAAVQFAKESKATDVRVCS